MSRLLLTEIKVEAGTKGGAQSGARTESSECLPWIIKCFLTVISAAATQNMPTPPGGHLDVSR